MNRSTMRILRWLAAALLLLAMELGCLPAAGAAPPARDQPRYQLPVPHATLVRAFDGDATKYGPGHRGADLAAQQGAEVRAASAGVVSFAGPVAGRSLVVVVHADGLRTTYEPVAPSVALGDRVAAGQVVGLLEGEHGGRNDVLHWGARRGDDYVDPMRLVRPLGVVRLVMSRSRR